MRIESIIFENIRKLAMHSKDSNKELKGNELRFKKINIICGPNGSGKSTIIDSIRCLKEHTLLHSISRENMRNNSCGKLTFEIDKIGTVGFVFNSCGRGEHNLYISYKGMKYNGLVSDENIPRNILLGFNEILNDVLNKSYSCFTTSSNILDVELFPISYNTPNINVSDREKFCKVLNKYSHYFIGLSKGSLPEYVYYYSNDSNDNQSLAYSKDDDENSICIYLNDDRKMSNKISLNAIPSGWRAFINIIIWLEDQKEETICLIEEPETHLHPKLQRILIENINRIQKEKELQVFIASHSTIFIDPRAWEDNDVALFSSDGYGITDQIDKVELFSNLGIKPADALQSNGLLWVEGPSDRIYIKHWLELYAKKHDKKIMIENIHYSFILYGGALMKYYSSSNDGINLEEINKNSLFIIDNDLGVESYKEKIKRGERINSLVTKGYTIEDYLPSAFFKTYFDRVCSKKMKKMKNMKITTSKRSVNKVEVALKFVQDNKYNRFDDSYKKGSNLEDFIKKIYDEINNWNTYRTPQINEM